MSHHEFHGSKAFTRRTSLVGLALLSTLLTSSCGDDRDHDVWRFAIEETKGSVQDAYAQEFKRLIDERSGGAIEVKVYPHGTLGTSDDLTEQLRMGALQFCMASPGHLGKTIPEVQAFLLHFVFDDDNDVNQRALEDPELAAVLAPLFAEKEMGLLSIFPEGWMVWTTQRPVRAPSDLDGMKIRTMTSPILLETYETYGATPQAMPYSEVYSGLQLHMIDAQENPIFAIEEMSFYEVTSHMIFARHAQFITTAVTNQRFIEGLSQERRLMVEQAARDAAKSIYAIQKRYNEERLERIRQRKPQLVVTELTDDERNAFKQKSLPVRETFFTMAGARGRRVLEALLAALARAAR